MPLELPAPQRGKFSERTDEMDVAPGGDARVPERDFAGESTAILTDALGLKMRLEKVRWPVAAATLEVIVERPVKGFGYEAPNVAS